MDVEFRNIIITPPGDHYAAQDFELLPDGVPPFFAASETQGVVTFGYASIIVSDLVSNDNVSDDLEDYPDGDISLLNKSTVYGFIAKIGYVYPPIPV